MALPKRRHSKSRRDKRRTHHKLSSPTWSLCPQCNLSKLPHHACSHCGYYKGRQVIEVEKKEKKEK